MDRWLKKTSCWRKFRCHLCDKKGAVSPLYSLNHYIFILKDYKYRGPTVPAKNENKCHANTSSLLPASVILKRTLGKLLIKLLRNKLLWSLLLKSVMEWNYKWNINNNTQHQFKKQILANSYYYYYRELTPLFSVLCTVFWKSIFFFCFFFFVSFCSNLILIPRFWTRNLKK